MTSNSQEKYLIVLQNESDKFELNSQKLSEDICGWDISSMNFNSSQRWNNKSYYENEVNQTPKSMTNNSISLQKRTLLTPKAINKEKKVFFLAPKFYYKNTQKIQYVYKKNYEKLKNLPDLKNFPNRYENNVTVDQMIEEIMKKGRNNMKVERFSNLKSASPCVFVRRKNYYNG